MDSTESKGDDLVVTANAITDDLSPQTHDQLDQHARKFASSFAFDSEAPDILFGVISLCAHAYSQTQWPIDVPDATTCTQLLASNQEIRDLLEKAYRTGHYCEIRRRGERTFPRSPFLY
jgi:hypothetical protein